MGQNVYISTFCIAKLALSVGDSIKAKKLMKMQGFCLSLNVSNLKIKNFTLLRNRRLAQNRTTTKIYWPTLLQTTHFCWTLSWNSRCKTKTLTYELFFKKTAWCISEFLKWRYRLYQNLALNYTSCRSCITLYLQLCFWKSVSDPMKTLIRTNGNLLINVLS